MIKKTATVLMLAIAALGFSGIAAAQNNAEAATQQQPTQQQQQARQLLQKLRQKTVKLQKIHAQTLKNNPELQQQQQELMSMVQDAIEAQGYDIEAGKERVKNMTQKLQSGDLSKEERKALMQDFAAERRSLAKARAAALQQPEIQEASKQLQQDTLAAMKAENENVETLMQEMQQLRQKLRSTLAPASAK